MSKKKATNSDRPHTLRAQELELLFTVQLTDSELRALLVLDQRAAQIAASTCVHISTAALPPGLPRFAGHTTLRELVAYHLKPR